MIVVCSLGSSTTSYGPLHRACNFWPVPVGFAWTNTRSPRATMKFVATNIYEICAQTGEVFHYVSLTYDEEEANELVRELQQQPQQEEINKNNEEKVTDEGEKASASP